MTIIEVSFFYMRHSITYKNCTLPIEEGLCQEIVRCSTCFWELE